MARDEYDEDAYSVDDIYTGGAKDDQGHSTNLRVRVPDHWMPIIQSVVQHPDWPEYRRSDQAFIRDAIWHRLQWAQHRTDRGQDPRVRGLVLAAQKEQRLAQHEAQRSAYKSLLEGLQATMKNALADGDRLSMATLLEDMRHEGESFDEPFRSALLNECDYWEKRIRQQGWMT